MALIACAECHREISSSAEACPHCGYPLKKPEAAGPKCYRCGDPATTLCQGGCGRTCCVKHLKHIVVTNLKYAANELRCEECHEKAVEQNETMNALGCFIISVVVCVLGFCGYNIWTIERESKKEREIRQKQDEEFRRQFQDPNR